MYHRIIHFTDIILVVCLQLHSCFLLSPPLYHAIYAGRIWLLQSLEQSVRAWCIIVFGVCLFPKLYFALSELEVKMIASCCLCTATSEAVRLG